MNRSHSFNSVHGRMPSVTTGAVLANSDDISITKRYFTSFWIIRS